MESNQNIILGKSLTNMMANPEVKAKCKELIEAVEKCLMRAKDISEALKIYRETAPSEWDSAVGDFHISVLKGVLKTSSQVNPTFLSLKNDIDLIEKFNYSSGMECRGNFEVIKASIQHEHVLINSRLELLQKSKKENTGFFNWLRYFLGKSK